ncbi:hypothetical protein DSUL_50373 [Desulfovibrionales bacterium]
MVYLRDKFYKQVDGGAQYLDHGCQTAFGAVDLFCFTDGGVMSSLTLMALSIVLGYRSSDIRFIKVHDFGGLGDVGDEFGQSQSVVISLLYISETFSAN